MLLETAGEGAPRGGHPEQLETPNNMVYISPKGHPAGAPREEPLGVHMLLNSCDAAVRRHGAPPRRRFGLGENVDRPFRPRFPEKPLKTIEN